MPKLLVDLLSPGSKFGRVTLEQAIAHVEQKAPAMEQAATRKAPAKRTR